MTIRTLRLLIGINIAALLAVAAIHAGAFGGDFQTASMYEIGMAIVLGMGLALTFAGQPTARWGAFVAQLIALFGVGTGIYMASRGMAPNTPWDFAYHAFAVLLLVAGLWGAVRLRPERAGVARGRAASGLDRPGA